VIPGKLHPYQRLMGEMREILLSMGFTELYGGVVQSAFWNFDALFQPQDHPAREMHDTFYLKSPKTVDIEGFDRYKGEIGKTHRDGGSTGSTGWGYKWDEETAKKTLLRTHTTAVTARYLSKIRREDLPVKVFSIGKVFRNEAVDYKHLPEFYQVEGIVVDPAVNFTNLLGILKQFYNEMGFDKVRFRPGYFPYTEMSIEPEVYMEDRRQWIELGGSGIFRPEVVKPLLGFECPVLAWGLGLDRIVTLGLGMNDIRNLYMSDLEWLKEN
jgi:phenylalanyl-tRNA synthetase alpha chain